MVALLPFLPKIDGVLTLSMGLGPDWAAGNAQFFGPDLACLIQVRPLLKADFTGAAAGRGGNALLLVRSDDST